ncbi:hypothetical protein DFJ73DRAFT_107912 [Zopfochytrium polystomum]|nr:hypothetical protein DFJ73DRAFT_107912 [Zopfochytrium polystomum]
MSTDPLSGNGSPFDEESILSEDRPIIGGDDEDDSAGRTSLLLAPEPADLYAILNVDKNASEEDIKNAYRRMCMTFHPDKHQRQEDKEATQKHFQSIQKAYDVLSNPGRRFIYDKHGMEGVTRSWELGSRFRTQEEMREEYERMSRQQLEADVEGLVKSRGEIHVGFDTSHILDPFDKLPRSRRLSRNRRENASLWDRIRYPELSQAVVRHSWETSITPQTDFTIVGAAVARNGMGSGTVQGTVRHAFTPSLIGEFTGTLGQQPSGSVKIVNKFSQDAFVTVSTAAASFTNPPPIVFVLGRKLSKNFTGFMTYRTGPYAIGPWGAVLDPSAPPRPDLSSCGLGVVRRDAKSQTSFEIAAGSMMSSISLSYFRSLFWGIKARAAFSLSTLTGVSGSVTADRKISTHDRFGMGVEFGSMGGVTFRLRYARLGQKFSIPLLLTPVLDLQMAVLATMIPVASLVASELLVLQPRRKRKTAMRLAQIRADNAEILLERKNAALEAQNLMREQVVRKRESEDAKNGLVIVEAVYGRLPESDVERVVELSRSAAQESASSAGSEEDRAVGSEDQPWVDVTLPVQGLVSGSQLHISGGHSKSHIVGFYDPCLGERKKLRLTYKFQGKLHQVEVDDRAPVAAPLRAHIISDYQ